MRKSEEMTGQTEPSVEALKNVPFFAKLSPDELRDLAERLVPRRFGSGQVIFHLGDPGGLLYIILEGTVKISNATPEGQEALLAILGTGDFFGELALLDDASRSATAEALQPTQTITLHRDEFIRFLSDNPEFAYHVLQTLARRIRHLNDQINDVFFLDLNGRLARTLTQSRRTSRAENRRRDGHRPLVDADRSRGDDRRNACQHQQDAGPLPARPVGARPGAAHHHPG
jgi:CRP/FNR family transcriptional regulator, cyclic AMP receptor protein